MTIRGRPIVARHEDGHRFGLLIREHELIVDQPCGRLGSPTWRAAPFRPASDLRALVQGADLVVESVLGAVYYPPAAALARAFAPIDRRLGRLTTIGAAFIPVAGTRSRS